MTLVLMLPLIMVLSACTWFGDSNDLVGPYIDNEYDLEDVGEEELFMSKQLNLVTEINGSYKIDRAFRLDYEDENKRVYDDLYFYEDDFFYMTTTDNKYLWCYLTDETDLEYVEVEKEAGEDIQINIKVTGRYKLIFDIITKSFDLEYLGKITTPVYEEIESCEVGYLIDVNGEKTMKYDVMQKVGNEFALLGTHFAVGQSAGFYSKFTHTSWYKTTIEESCANRYIHKRGTKANTDICFMVGGEYNIYLNPKTYVVRVELVAADEDGYSANVFVDENLDFVNDPIQLELLDQNKNYEFVFQCRVTSELVGNYQVVTTELPKIYNDKLQSYELVPTAESLTADLVRESAYHGSTFYYFNKAGVYNLIINLKTFEINVELVTE